MKAGDIVRFFVYNTGKPDEEVVGRVVCAFAHGVLRIERGDNLGTYQMWESHVTALSDSEAFLWKLENA